MVIQMYVECYHQKNISVKMNKKSFKSKIITI